LDEGRTFRNGLDFWSIDISLGLVVNMDQLLSELEHAALEAFQISADRHHSESIYCAALYTSGEYGYVYDTISTQEGLNRVAEHYLRKGSFDNFEKAVHDLKWSPCDSPYHLENEHLFEKCNQLLREIWGSLRKQPERDSDSVYRDVHSVFVKVLKKVRSSNIFPSDCLITLLAGDQSNEVRVVNSEEINSQAVCHAFASELMLNNDRLAKLRANRWPSDDSYEP